jgi:hypothetical protein
MEFFILVAKNTALQFLLIFGVFIAGGFLLTWLSRWTNNVFRQFIFPNFGMYVFGIVGIPVHEFSHAFFCKVFLHEVKKVKWFDPKARHGAHGSVTHYFNPYNPYHRLGHFFIGLGPAIVGPVALALLFRFLVPGAAHAFELGPSGVTTLDFSSVISSFFSTVFTRANFSSVGFYVFIYLAVAISSQIELSSEDMKQARTGVIPLVLILLVINLVAGALRSNWHGLAIEMGFGLMAFWSCLFLFAGLLSALNLAFWTLIMGGLNRLFGRGGINPFVG